MILLSTPFLGKIGNMQLPSVQIIMMGITMVTMILLTGIAMAIGILMRTDPIF